jgi:hypothetical protein
MIGKMAAMMEPSSIRTIDVEIEVQSAFPAPLRQEIEALFHSADWGDVWIRERVVTNRGAGGPGGVSITIFLTSAAGAALGGLLKDAIEAGLREFVHLTKRVGGHVLHLRDRDSNRQVSYRLWSDNADDDVNAMLDAIPADIEHMIAISPGVWRTWQNGSWHTLEFKDGEWVEID